MTNNNSDPLIAILLVFFNEAKHIPSLVNSIKNQTYGNIRVFAIDNNSSDNSADLFDSLMPNATLIKSNSNSGYAKGNNKLANKALGFKPEYHFILNTDMVIDKNCIGELVHVAESDKLIGILSPIVFKGHTKNDRNTIQFYGGKANFDSGSTIINNSIHNLPELMETNAFHGGAAFIRTNIFESIGLFNEDNFLYGDELDLAYRFKKTKYKMMVTKKAVAWHFHDWSKKNKKGFYLQYYYMLRNRFLFFYRYKKYNSLTIQLIRELLLIPLTIRWAIRKADIKLVKYYYLGILHGLLNKTGKANVRFI